MTERMLQNKQEYIDLIKSISREFDKDAFITMLEETDFFEAPASSKYHNAFPGGLCEHCINVYKRLSELNTLLSLKLDEDSIIIASLCHDLSKINYYMPSVRNEKVYSQSGSKHDELGNYDWVSTRTYSVKPTSQRFIYANHEVTAEMITKSYIPLTYDESIAILHHHGGMSSDCAQDNLGEIFNYSSLALCLHLADMIASFINENRG